MNLIVREGKLYYTQFMTLYVVDIEKREIISEISIGSPYMSAIEETEDYLYIQCDNHWGKSNIYEYEINTNKISRIIEINFLGDRVATSGGSFVTKVVVEDNIMYVLSLGAYLTAIDLTKEKDTRYADGEKMTIWQIPNKTDKDFVEGKVALVAEDSILLLVGDYIYMSSRGYTYKINKYTGESGWDIKKELLGSECMGSAYINNKIISGVMSGPSMRAIDEKTGDIIWESEKFRGSPGGIPVAYNGKVYVPSASADWVCLDGQTGKIIWQIPGSGFPESQTAAIDEENGIIYLVCSIGEDRLVAVKAE